MYTRRDTHQGVQYPPGCTSGCTVPTRVYLRVYIPQGYASQGVYTTGLCLSGCVILLGVPRGVLSPGCTSGVYTPGLYLRVYTPGLYLRVWLYPPGCISECGLFPPGCTSGCVLRVIHHEARLIGRLWEIPIMRRVLSAVFGRMLPYDARIIVRLRVEGGNPVAQRALTHGKSPMFPTFLTVSHLSDSSVFPDSFSPF